jgi:hypothetical protein
MCFVYIYRDAGIPVITEGDFFFIESIPECASGRELRVSAPSEIMGTVYVDWQLASRRHLSGGAALIDIVTEVWRLQ